MNRTIELGNWMNLYIRNVEAYGLAHKLAELTGKSMTQVVTEALRDSLSRVGQRQAKVEAVLAIGRDCAKHMKEPLKSMDHGDLLYDELGLPK